MLSCVLCYQVTQELECCLFTVRPYFLAGFAPYTAVDQLSFSQFPALKVCTLTNLKRLITKSHAILLSVFKHTGKQQKSQEKKKKRKKNIKTRKNKKKKRKYLLD